jgi:hypothetical protein
MEEKINNFRSLIFGAFSRTKSSDIKEQIVGYKTLINFAKEKNWIM